VEYLQQLVVEMLVDVVGMVEVDLLCPIQAVHIEVAVCQAQPRDANRRTPSQGIPH
jgi:hypothetical protein